MRGGKMYEVSDAYRESMKNPLRNASHMKVTLGVINDTAQSQALLSNQSQYAGFSDFDGVFEQKEVQSQYATYENNFWLLDGSMRFLPDAAAQYEPVGIVSKNLFSSSFSVKMTFQESVDIAGLTIKFAGNYPSKFSIITSDGTSKSYSNSSLNFTTDDRFDNTTSLEIKVTAMSATNNRVRIESILFGNAVVFTDNDIINAESTSTMSQINEDLPEINFTLTFDNNDKKFDYDNKESIINYLRTGQDVVVQMGYDLDNGTTEWILLHTLKLSEWSASDDEASIKAVDVLQQFGDGDYYRGDWHAKGITLYALANYVIADAIGTYSIPQDKFFIDKYLKSVEVRNPIPLVSHKEALQIIANAGRCVLTVDRYGKICIKSAFDPDAETTSTETAYFSDVSNVNIDNEKTRYATYEDSMWQLGKRPPFLPRAGVKDDVGFVTKDIAPKGGTFSTPPQIVKTFEVPRKSNGMKIKVYYMFPRTMSINTYLKDQIVESIGISDGKINYADVKTWTTDHQFKEFDKMVIEFGRINVNTRLVVDYIELGENVDYTIERDDMYSSPTMSKPENIKRLKNIRTVYSKSDTLEEVVSEEVEWTNETLLYTFDEPHHSYTASLENQANGQSVEILDSGAYFVELKLIGNDSGKKVQVIVNGKKFNQSNAYSVAEISNYGVEKDWSNPLISDKELCDKVCKWVADYYNPGIDYSIDYRGEPALDAGDTIYQENRDGEMVKTVAESVSLTYDGTVSGTLETRR